MTTAETLAQLRAPFPAEAVGKLPRATSKDGPKSRCNTCGAHIQQHIHLDYVGHAAVTDRLLSVDPCWNWEPLSYEDDGQPRFVRNSAGGPIGLWIKLTVGGVTRLGYGSTEPLPDAVKVLIGDALRNAAMRFGVALEFWSKDELESHLGDDGEKPARATKSRPVDRARAAVAQAKSGGGGELSGGSAEALAPAPAGQPLPADVIGALTQLDARSRAVVRGKWGEARVTAESDPVRAMALLRGVADV